MDPLKRINTIAFNGKAENFPLWQTQMKSYLFMHDAAGPLADNADLKDSDMAKRNCVLFHYLCVALTESAAHVVSQVAFGDGVQLWNRLQEIYASDSQASVMNMHSKLLNTRLSSFSSLADFVGALSKWPKRI